MSFNYFAYGSNMFTPKMKIAALSAEFRMIGLLPSYVLRFNKHSSEDGSGKGNIIASGNAGDEVWGVVFEIDQTHRPGLDASEGGYIPLSVEVLVVDKLLPVHTYIAKPGRTDNSLKPYTWYKELVTRGARQHELPETYVQGLDAVEAIDDPNEERVRRNLALLAR